MKNDFNEELLSKRRDPADAQDLDFDWQQLYQRLSEDVASGQIEQALAETITRLLQMLIPLREKYLPPETVGLNVIALAWVLNPAYFHGSPSLRQLARRCGVASATLARHTAHYSRLIGWRNRAQQHAWNFRRERSDSDEDADQRQVGHRLRRSEDASGTAGRRSDG